MRQVAQALGECSGIDCPQFLATGTGKDFFADAGRQPGLGRCVEDLLHAGMAGAIFTAIARIEQREAFVVSQARELFA